MDGTKMLHSFEVDHRWLKQGIYVADKYLYTNPTFVVTILDLRFVRPKDPREKTYTISPKAIHTIEHLGKMYLSNLPEWKDRIIHFGPMGCRTGFYLVLAGDYNASIDSPVYSLVVGMCRYILDFNGNVPGANMIQCGNCREHNLRGAQRAAALYLNALINDPQFLYPLA